MSDRDFEWDYAADITKSDTVDLNPIPIGLHVKTTAGLVELEFQRPNRAGTTVNEGIYIALGDYVKVRPRKVKSTGTDAVGIVGLYRTNKNR